MIKKILHPFFKLGFLGILLCCIHLKTTAQTVEINYTPFSYSGSIVAGQSTYHASESVYLESEIGASNFITPGTAINTISFLLNSVTATTLPKTLTGYEIYMKNVPLTDSIFANGSYSFTGYTLVYSGDVTFSSNINWTTINLTTTFTRTAGSNLKILILRTSALPSVASGLVITSSLRSDGMGSYTSTSRRYNGTNAPSPSESLTANIYRPAIRLSAPCTPTASTIYDTICSGTSYTFNGIAQTTAGTYLDTLVNAGGCDSVVTLNLTVNTTPSAPIATTDSVCAPGGTVNLSAVGNNIQWYDQLLGGTLLNSGTTFNPSISADSTYYITHEGGINGTATMPSQTSTLIGNTRGYFFTAPTNFTITSLQVPTTASSGNQSIAVVKFNGNTPPPDYYVSSTNAFTTLFLTQNNPTVGNIAVNIPILAGEVIGILGVRNNVNSYSSTANTTIINGLSVPLKRLGMQFPLSTTLPQDLWTESSGSISRIEFEYAIGNGCFSTPRTPVVAKLNPLPVIGSASATPSTICTGDSSLLKITNALANDIWVTTPITYNSSGSFNQANLLSCIKITIPTTSTIDGLWLDNDGMTASTFANLVLYSDSAGFPKTKIVEGVAQNNMPLGRVFFPISDIILSPGDYWVGVNTSEFLYSRYSVGMGNSVKLVVYNQLFSAGFPSTISASTTLTTGVANGQGVQIKAPTPATSFVWSSATTLVNATADSTLAFPTTTTNYTVTASSALGCTATSSVTVTNNSTGGLAQATSNNTASISGNTNQTFTQNDGMTHTYTDANCNVISTINDGAGGNVLGSTVSSVTVDASVQTYNSQPYVRRHYTITPTNQGAATVTLYLTQADFDDYNANNGTYLDLPTGPSDATGIGNVRITKVNGVLGVAAAEVITPTLAWDAVNMYWTATFSVSSFSSFYFHAVNAANSPLPVTLLSFTGKKETTANVLNWTTSMEQNNAYFNVQRSQDARNFTTIAKVNTKAINGSSSSLLNYELQDENPKVGHNYYRLQQVDNDGKSTLSQVIDLYRDANGNVVNVYPNPTSSNLHIELTSDIGQLTSIKLSDLSGRIIKEITTTNNVSQIDMSNIATGMYLLQVEQDNQIISTQKVERK